MPLKQEVNHNRLHAPITMKTALIFALTLLCGGVSVTASACSIDTVGEALVAGHWRTSEDLLYMSHDDERNTLITELNLITSESVDWLQGRSDGELIEFAAVAIFLRGEGIRREDELAGMSTDDQRNTLITQLHMWTDDPVDELQAKTDSELVEIGCAFTGELYLAAEVLTFDWDVDNSQLVEETPALLSEQLVDNCNSSVSLGATFTFSKSITESTTFVRINDIRTDFQASLTFEAKIPFVAKEELETSISLGYSRTWGDEELNAVTETYEDVVNIEVPAGQAVLVKALTIITKMDVPYTMTVRTALNTTQVLTGVWKGVSMAELQKTQADIPCYML